MSKPSTPQNGHSRPGVICANEAYTLLEVKLRLGFKDAGLREARRKGLKIRQIGRNRYCLGEDVISFLKEQPVCE